MTDSKTATELRTCADCGGQIVMECFNNDDLPGKRYDFTCYGCGRVMHLYANNEKGAAKAWNAMVKS